MFRPRVILHPTDFSDSSTHALHIAVDLARLHQARLLVLHVVETLGADRVTYGEAVSQREPAGYRRRLEDELRRHVPAPAGVAVDYLLAEGEPEEEINRVAQKYACDLIVLGTHGRTGLRRLLLGSVAEQVIRHAPCPVLTSRIPEPAAAATATVSAGRGRE